MKIFICNNPAGLKDLDATVEAEYGDAVAVGTKLTMAHHGPRTGQKAPCAYDDCSQLGISSIGISHVDLDTVGGILAILGQKPNVPSFWQLAEFIDLNGPHKLHEATPSVEDERRLWAYWAFSQTHRVYAPRDGSTLDVTDQVLEHAATVQHIINGDQILLEAGDEHRNQEAQLNRDSFLRWDGNHVIVRKSNKFVNHLYCAPDGRIATACVNLNPGPDFSGGAITVSLADPIPSVDCGKLLKELFGPQAGGHAGIGGSPRGKEMTSVELDATVAALRKLIG